MPLISFSITEDVLVLHTPMGSVASNSQIQAPVAPPSVTNEENLAFAFLSSPTSGLLYHSRRRDVEVLVDDRQTLLITNNNELGPYIPVSLGMTDFGPLLQPVSINPADSSGINAVMAISGLAGVNNKFAVPLEYADATVYTNGSHQVITDTAQVLLGPILDLGYKSDGEHFEAGNILISAASTSKLFNAQVSKENDAYAKGGSVFILSGEGGYYTGDIYISTHDAQDTSSPFYKKQLHAITSGKSTLRTGNVINLQQFVGSGPHGPLNWSTFPYEPPKSGEVLIETGEGTSSGDIHIKTGGAEVFSDPYGPPSDWSTDRAGNSGSIFIEAGNLTSYYGYTGPTRVYAGSVVVKAGDLSAGDLWDTIGITPGEVLLVPGEITNNEAGHYTGLIRAAGTAGFQIPFGSEEERPTNGVSTQYWADTINGYSPNPGNVEKNANIGVLRACSFSNQLIGEPGSAPVWIEMWNSGDWQRFYSEDYLVHRHHHNDVSNIWNITHNKGVFGWPLVQVYVAYNAGQQASGMPNSPGYKTLNPSEYEVYISAANPNALAIKFLNNSYSGVAIIRFTPQDPFIQGYMGDGSGFSGRGATVYTGV